jgi:hypothetical protein
VEVLENGRQESSKRVSITRKNDIYSNVNGIDVGNDVIFTVALLNTAGVGTENSDLYYTVRQNLQLGLVLVTENRGSTAGVGFSN